jgi:mannonate dehydratase
VLVCDNLPSNGKTVARIVGRYAELRDPTLAGYIANEVAFPSTMVDRIVPATTGADRAAVARLGYEDAITDWTRTDLMYRLPTGGYALRFDYTDLAAYDLFVLKRPGAEADHPPERRAAAGARFKSMSESDIAKLESILIDWLPAREFVYDRQGFQRMLDVYRDIGADGVRANMIEFVREVAQTAAEEGARLCIHPDDPSFPIFGMPRVMSTADDVRRLFAGVPDPASGLTLCSGAFGCNPENDLPVMAEEFGPRIHFVHLRNTTREPDGSFYEADHLDGDTDMIGTVAALLREEERRRQEGRADAVIPMRPDHGHLLIDDIGKDVNPGYSCIGRLKGLAEMRGVMRTIEAVRAGRVR